MNSKRSARRTAGSLGAFLLCFMRMNDPKQLFLFVGRIASGKETQGRMLAEKLGAPLFATGAKFREMIASNSPLGQRIKADYDAGKLMPAWVASYFFQDFLFHLPHASHAVFEGTGRAREEAEMFEQVANWLGRPYAVFNLVVSPETVVARSLARKRDAGDTEESVKTRLAEYERLTAPAIDYFKSIGKCIDINGEQSVDEIHQEVLSHVTIQ